MEAQPPSAYPGWVMFEHYLEVMFTDSTCFPTDDAKTLAAARTSAGHPIYVSLSLAEPPALSRVCLRIPIGVIKEEKFKVHKEKIEDKFKVLAAQGDSVLIQVSIEEKYQEFLPEYFVYNAGAAAAEPPRPPSLWLLPPYYEETYFSGGDLVPRALCANSTGILHRGEDDLVVAELTVTSRSKDKPRVGLLYLFRSGEWKIYHFEIREDWDLPTMSLNNAIPAGDCLLCWVESFYRGVMLIDVFKEIPTVQFVHLPKHPRDCKDLKRNVCTTAGGGTLKFINICGRCCCGASASCNCEHSRHAYTIHTWKMRIEDYNKEWVKDGIADASELWAQNGYMGLPCDPLDRPFVSLDEPEVICFRLSRCDSQALWQIMVNMRSKTIHSVLCHEREVGYRYRRDKLIPSSVSYFFNTLLSQVKMGDERPPSVDANEQPIKRENQCCNPALQPSSFTQPVSVQTFSEMFEALQEVPSLGLGSHELKAFRILISSDDNGRRLKSLSRLPKDLRKDWLLMEINSTDAY